jgi:uncharacterized protein (TIGR02145 family)
MKKTILLLAGLTFLTCKNNAQTVTDIDGNVYQTVTIGTQEWMVENLKTTRYNDGLEIPLEVNNTAWENLNTPGYCWYNNDTANKNPYGAIYNWYTVNTGKLAPEGWHVPTDAEWDILINFHGGASVAGGKMKSMGTIQSDSGLWYEPNTGAINSSGFTALPGGYRYFTGNFNFLGKNAFFWSSSKRIGSVAWSPILYYDGEQVYKGSSLFSYGFSVRCVKGFPLGNNNINDLNIIKLYPNPAADHLFIECAGRQDLNISIYNLVGVLMGKKELNRNTNEIDVSYLLKGIYIIHVIASDWKIQRKFIKD